MRKSITIVFTLLILACSGMAQNAVHNNQALQNIATAGSIPTHTASIPNAIITVCSGTTLPALGVTCTPTTTIYTGPTIATQQSNPFNADGNGNYTFWVSPGDYIVSVSGAGLTTYNYAIVASCDPTASCTVTGAMNLTGNLTATAGANTLKFTTPGPSPWIDVTDPVYGAKCDGSTDDTTAINAAITAAGNVTGNGGARVRFPDDKVCVFTTTLKSSGGGNGIHLSGGHRTSQILNGGTTPTGGGMLKYTGTTNPAISLPGAENVVENLAIVYTNAGFNGCLLDFDTAGISQSIQVRGNFLAGISTANAATLICLDNTENTIIEQNNFYWYANAIRGISTVNHFSTTERIAFNNFNGYTGTTSGTAHILNPGGQWKVIANTFEMLGVANGFAVLDATTSAFAICQPCSFDSNWVGDTPAGYTGTFLKLGSGQQQAEINGNFFTGGTSNLGTAISVANSGQAVHIVGNDFGQLATAVALGTSTSQIFIDANWYGSVTNSFTGAPTQGYINDGTHNHQIYGDANFCNTTNCTFKVHSASDIGRIYGGGTSNPNGMIIYASPGATGTSGPINFNDNDTDNHPAMIVTPSATATVAIQGHLNQAGSTGKFAGTCVFPSATTCSITYGTNGFAFTSIPALVFTPVNPGVVTFTLTSSTASGFTVTASASNSITVNWIAVGNPN